MVAMRPDETTIRHWLEEVPDPEIPVLSVVDLGVVRDIVWDGDALVVGLSPTYSGCPATQVIAEDVTRALKDRGVEKVRIQTRLSPPWSTDWISAKGLAKIQAYGIAPPDRSHKGPKACPRCESADVEVVSAYGSTPCKAQWRCRSCLEPFEYFKCL